jgi:hypothetical protein
MLNVAYKITLGSDSLKSGKSGLLVGLDCRASLGIPANSCGVRLDGQASLGAKPGDEVKVELGYDKSLEKVFTGKVARIERALDYVRVEALGSFTELAAWRLNRVYEKQNAGDIAGDLLGKLKIGKGSLESGEKFATFVVSDRETVWDALFGLALRCGFDFYADTSDKANFKKFAAKTTHTFEYGAHILEFEQEALAPALDGVEIYGESPVGQGQGEDASSWLTKKTVKGSAGKTSGRVLRQVDASARTQSLVRSLAGNILKASQAESRGRIRTLGAPQVKLGDSVKVSKLPEASQNGTYKVTGVRHQLNHKVGFVTEITWEKV